MLLEIVNLDIENLIIQLYVVFICWVIVLFAVAIDFYFGVQKSKENGNILIDLANSVTSAIGDKVIYLRGARTSASDSAVSYLEGLGFTVTITP